MRWIVVLVVGAAISTLVGIFVTKGVETADRANSLERPLESIVLPMNQEVPNGFTLLVQDPGRLPGDMSVVKDCGELWAVGLRAGGIPPKSYPVRLSLRGLSKETISIIEMRAQVLRHSQAADGVVLYCESDKGGIEPIQMRFDLVKGDHAELAVEGPPGQYSPKFANGYVISIAPNEIVPLVIDPILPADSVTWNIEADMLVAGEPRTLVIRDGVSDFVSYGQRRWNDYEKGYSASFSENSLMSWGIVARPNPSPGPARTHVDLGPLRMPSDLDLDLYQKTGDTSPHSRVDGPNLWIRSRGRFLVAFSQNASLDSIPDMGSGCYDGRGFRSGVVKARSLASTETLLHTDQEFVHSTYDYVCDQTSFTLYTAQKVDSPTIFQVRSDMVGGEEVPAAIELLHSIELLDP